MRTDKIKVTCIGIQSAGNFSVDAAEGVDHALKPYDHHEESLKFSVQGTDAGGGGTRKDLADKVESRGRVKEYAEYIWCTCSLHGLNLTLSSPTNLIMGDGGLLKRNALQCLHTAYNLAQQYHYEEWKNFIYFYENACDESLGMCGRICETCFEVQRYVVRCCQKCCEQREDRFNKTHNCELPY